MVSFGAIMYGLHSGPLTTITGSSLKRESISEIISSRHHPRLSHEPKLHVTDGRSECGTVGTTAKKWLALSTA